MLARIVLLLCMLLVVPVSATGQTVLWFAGAETGDVSETNTVNLMSAVGTGFTGCCAFTGGNQNSHARSPTGLGGTTIYVRQRWKYDPGINNNYSAIVVSNAAASAYITILRVNASSKLCWTLTSGACITTGATVLSSGTWYLLEAKFVIHASAGGVELKINGATEFTSLGTNTSAIGTWDFYQMGPDSGFVGTVLTNTDDVMICSGAYCPAGRTIARQGAAGTPTYNAWTKNSCTGGVISGCWSNTPFTTGSNASSGTASDAQTMLVSSFASTQTGHGTETVGNISTINACKTAVVMKSGTASAPISIRRRLSGADTDTSKTLTTSDAYYDDGIWTTTAAVLRGSTMEIGAVHGSGSATDTVEDMWLICDYLDASAAIRHRVTQDGN